MVKTMTGHLPLLPPILWQALRANQAAGLVYLNNPKVACSTIKAALWRQVAGDPPEDHDSLHRLPGSPFDPDARHLAWAEKAFVFTLVRNPYSRLLSAYLDKIRGRKGWGWSQLVVQHALNPDEAPSFDAFVEMIADDSPETLDAHWKPQVLNVLHPLLHPNFTGRFESIAEDLPAILAQAFGRPIPVARRDEHATGATEHLGVAFADPGTVARVRRLYAEDFDIWAYPTDLAAGLQSRLRSVLLTHSHPAFPALAAYLTAAPAEKTSLLAQLTALPGGAALQDWVLAERLRLGHGGPAGLARLLQEEGPRIEAGWTYLKAAADEAVRRRGTTAKASETAIPRTPPAI